MKTEDKIREAFEKSYGEVSGYMCEVTYHDQFEHFKAGYLALLNELVISGSIICGDTFAKHGVKYDLYEGVYDEGGYWDCRGYQLIPIYRLPEGVNRD
jgi:hypothetical protein